jgi:hypothetical protein
MKFPVVLDRNVAFSVRSGTDGKKTDQITGKNLIKVNFWMKMYKCKDKQCAWSSWLYWIFTWSCDMQIGYKKIFKYQELPKWNLLLQKQRLKYCLMKYCPFFYQVFTYYQLSYFSPKLCHYLQQAVFCWARHREKKITYRHRCSGIN